MGVMLAVALTVLAFAAGTSQATDAAELIAEGIKLRKDNRDQEALPLFRDAFQQQPSPRAAGQLGTCEQALGMWVHSEEHIQQALNQHEDAWVKRNATSLRASLDYVRQRLGSIEVWGGPAGARILVDGNLIATLPMRQAVRLSVGRRTLLVEAPGFISDTRTVEVLPAALIREYVPLRSAVLSPPTLASPSADLTAATPTEPATDHQDKIEASPIYTRWWFWAIVGTVAVGAGGTAYFLTTRNNSCVAPMGGTCTTF